MLKVPVLSPDGKPLMPTEPSQARCWIRDGLAVGKWSDSGVFYVQLTQWDEATVIESLESHLSNAPSDVRSYLFDLCMTFAEEGAHEGFRSKIELLCIAVGVC